MKNPLNRRFLRELRHDPGKYIVIFLLLTLTIGLVSGFLVADGSMIRAYNESFETYRIEDGHFRVSRRLNRAQWNAIEENGVTLHELFYVEKPVAASGTSEPDPNAAAGADDPADVAAGTLRIYPKRTEVDLECLMEGRWPAGPDEIAVDRMYADNNSLSAGSVISVGGTEMRITGLVALSDYSALFENNTDSMFDAVKFSVAIVSEETFSSYSNGDLFWNYAYFYPERPADKIREKEWSEDLMKAVNREVPLSDFVPQYLNQAITFTGEDMGGDRSMMLMLLYIIIAILAFVISIIINSTVASESAQIGTLRASGYSRGELLRHYMALPLLVSLAGAVAGNLLGYTALRLFCANLYYGSYSLPTYVTVWSADAFLLTTAVPLVMMAAIMFVILRQKLSLSPLQFLRGDLTRRKKKRAVPLSPRIPFFSRFRTRVLLQNAGNYVMLLIGVIFANLLLLFGLDLPVVLDHFEEDLKSNLFADYQYMLQLPMDAMDDTHKLRALFSYWLYQNGTETDEPTAEKFSVYSLDYEKGDGKSEAVILYGVEPGSRYVEVPEGKTYISAAFSDKYGIAAGDTVTLKEPYDTDRHTFTVDGIYDYMGALAIFTDRAEVNRRFDLGSDYFGGYFSQQPITDIRSEYVASVVDLEALTKVSRQLHVSFGGMMGVVEGFAVVIFMILVYLLSKLIIEKNAQAISMTKILGYSNREIGRLYILPTTIAVAVSLVLSLPIVDRIMAVLFRIMMAGRMTGWIPYYRNGRVFVTALLMGAATYAVVAVLEYRKVKKVPMDEALKNRE